MKTRSRGLAGGVTLALVGLGLVVPAAPATADPPEPTSSFTSFGNPILSDGSYYSADAAPMVHDGKLFIYHGQDASSPTFGDFTMPDYGVFVTEELNPAGEATEWELYRSAMDPDVFSWATGNKAFAGHVAQGPDGRFYWYAPVETKATTFANRMAIGVAVSDSPVGPWTDAIGEPLLDWGDVFGSSSNGQEVIDPHLFRDDDGRNYLYWGSWYNARMVELEADMVTRADSTIHHWTQQQGLPAFFEAPWVFKRNGTYYMVYDWKQGGSECTPSNYQGCIGYSTAPSPTGPWTFQGLILGGTSATTVHPSVIEFDGSWYITYHTKDAVNGGHFRRSVAIDEITWDDSQTPARLLPAAPTLDPARDRRLAATENVALGARPSASYTETPPMDVRALNNGRVTTALLPPDQWGNYRAARNVESDWTQYDWTWPVLIDGVGIQFHQDSNWIRTPASWSLQYRDADGEWQDVPNPSGFPTSANTWHEVSFDPVLTTGLRATYQGRPNAGLFHSVAVSEWEVYGVQATSLGSVSVGTVVGDAPALPATVEAELPGELSIEVPVIWYPVPRSAYSAPGTFSVTGRALGQAGALVEAEVTVVPEGPAVNHALEAALTASYTASWNNLAAVNDGTRGPLGPSPAPGNATFWGTWAASRPASQWLQYVWDEPVDLGHVVVGFVADGGPGRGTGIEIPESWSLEYWDGEGWVPVTGVDPDFPVEQGSYVAVSFDPVRTTRLRLTADATLGWLSGGTNEPGAYAGVGVSEWEAWSAAPDTTAPELSLTPQGTRGRGEWFVSPVEVRIDAQDDSFARVTIETSLDGGDTWDEVADVRSHSVTLGAGEHELSVRATDASGNVSAVASLEVKVDPTAPTLTAVGDEEARTVTVTASDAGSGIHAVEVNVDEAGWVAYSAPLELDEQRHVVQVRASDLAGNNSTRTVVLAEVTGPPSGNIGPLATVSASYTASWNNLDAVNDGVKPSLLGTPENSTFWGTWSGSRPSSQWLEYTWDTPVAIEAVTIGFASDGGPGRGTGIEIPESWFLEYWTGSNWAPVTNVKPDYPVSGTEYVSVGFDVVETTRVRVTLNALVGWLTGENDAPGEYAGVGVTELEVFTEGAGPDIGDTQAPELEVTVDPAAPNGEEGWYTSEVTVTAAASDDEDESLVVERLLGSEWVPVTEPIVVGEGVSTVTLRAVDASDNVSEEWSQTFRVDSTSPVSRADLDGRTVTLASADSGSRVARIEYSLDGAAFSEYSGPLTVPGSGAVELLFRGVDTAGNVEELGKLRIPAVDEHLARTTLLAILDSSRVAYGQPARLQLRLVAAGAEVGSPSVTITDGGTVLRTVRLSDGRAIVSLPRTLAVRTHRLEVSFAGSAELAPTQARANLKVVKARTSTRLSIKPAKGTIKPGKRATATVKVRAAGLVAQGKVRVRVIQAKGKKVLFDKKVPLDSKGNAKVKLPKLKATGTYRVKVAFQGSAQLAKSSAKQATLRVKR